MMQDPAFGVPPQSGYGVRVPDSVPQAPTTLERAQDEIGKLLGNTNVKEMRAIAKTRGVKLKGNLRDDIIRQMIEHLSNPDQIRPLLEHLVPSEQMALQMADLLTVPGQGITPNEIQSALQVLDMATAGKQNMLDPLQRLAESGLVISQKNYSGLLYFVPLAVRPYVLPLTALFSPYAGRVDSLRIIAPDPVTLPHHLYLVWQYLRSHPVLTPTPKPITGYGQHLLQGWEFVPAEVQALQQKTDWAYKPNLALSVPRLSAIRLEDASTREINQLLGSDDERLEFVLGLLAGLGMIRLQGRQLVAADQYMPAFLQLAPGERLHTLAETWLNGTLWSEMDLALRRAGRLRLRRNVSYGYINVTPDTLRAEFARGRQFLVRLLRQAEVGQWCNFAAFARAVFRLRPDFLQRTPATTYVPPKTWWLESEITGKPLDLKNEIEWQQSAGQFVQQVFAAPLAWLGIVELGYDASGLSAFRLTNLGAYLLGRPMTPTIVETRRPVELRDDLTATAYLGQTDLRAYDVLGRLGDLFESNARVFRYKLTAAHARSAFEEGRSPDDILAELAQFADGNVPQPIRDAFKAWWARYALIRIYPDLTVIECGDDFALPELLAATSLRRHLIYQLTPRLAVIDPKAVDVVINELVARGYTPKTEP